MKHNRGNRKLVSLPPKIITHERSNFLNKTPLDRIPEVGTNTNRTCNPSSETPRAKGKPTSPRLMFRPEDDESCGHGICTSYIPTETLLGAIDAFREAGFGKVTLSNDSAPVNEVRECCGEKTAQMLKTTLDEIHSSYPGSDKKLSDPRMRLQKLYKKHSYRMAEIADSGVKREESESALDFIARLEALVKQK